MIETEIEKTEGQIREEIEDDIVKAKLMTVHNEGYEDLLNIMKEQFDKFINKYEHLKKIYPSCRNVVIEALINDNHMKRTDIREYIIAHSDIKYDNRNIEYKYKIIKTLENVKRNITHSIEKDE
jgi:hypothetical protein